MISGSYLGCLQDRVRSTLRVTLPADHIHAISRTTHEIAEQAPITANTDTHDQPAGDRSHVLCAPGRIRTCAPASGGRDPACAPASLGVLPGTPPGLGGPGRPPVIPGSCHDPCHGKSI